MRIVVTGKLRKDGRYPVTYVFPLNGRQIRSLITPEKLEEEKGAGYQVSY